MQGFASLAQSIRPRRSYSEYLYGFQCDLDGHYPFGRSRSASGRRRITAILLLMVSTLAPSLPCLSQTRAQEVTVDFAKLVGKIRSLNGVNGGPLNRRGASDLSHYYQELGIEHVRLHDVPWMYWDDAVDVNYVFPHFDADPENPKNYDWALTDRYVQSIKALGAEMTFRLGDSGEPEIQRRVLRKPPADFAKWADICSHIVRHYNKGEMDGFYDNIKHWEIWNEPDISNFWSGTPTEYYQLYEITAKALKASDPEIKVGGPALTGHLDFLEGFLDHCQRDGAPLDFVSWHSYSANPSRVALTSVKIRELLDKHGFPKAESHLNEWNYVPGDWDRLVKDPAYARDVSEQIEGIAGAAYDASVLIALQDTPWTLPISTRVRCYLNGVFLISTVRP